MCIPAADYGHVIARLGWGADGAGVFFEGAMTRGYATNATDAAVMANVVAAGYSK